MTTLSLVQIIISIALVGSILLQQRGTGMSSVFGGESGFYHTRRGVEKVIFWVTIGLAVAFVAVNLAVFFVK